MTMMMMMMSSRNSLSATGMFKLVGDLSRNCNGRAAADAGYGKIVSNSIAIVC